MSQPSFLCPTCLRVTAAAVPLPCGHAFCLPCLQTMDQGLDRHSCPQCRQEYHPHYCYYYCGCNGYCDETGSSHSRTATLGGGGEAVEARESCGFQNKAPRLTNLGAEGITDSTVQETGGFQNKIQFIKANEMRKESHGSSEKGGLVAGVGEDEPKRGGLVEVYKNTTGNGETGEMASSGSCGIQSKSSVSADSELYDYLKSKMVESKPNLIVEKMTNEDGFQNKAPLLKAETQKESTFKESVQEMKTTEDGASCDFQNKTPNVGEDETTSKTATSEETNGDSGSKERHVFQNKTPLLKAETQMESSPEMKTAEDGASYDFQSKTPNVGVDETPNKSRQNKITIGKGDSGSEDSLVCQNKSPISEEDERKMAEAKSRLTSRVAELASELEKTESSLQKERQRELSVTAANAKLRANARTLAGDVASLARNFGERVLELMERELEPGEARVRDRAAHASERAERIGKAIRDAEGLLRERDLGVFTGELRSVESEMERCDGEKPRDDEGEVVFDLAKLCPELERLHEEFRERLGQVQRSLRSAFNPSEVTFDPETLHPNLVLSEDMKTVKFSVKKQPYPPSPQRFTSFFQVLSTQSFSAGVHRWEVELEGAPWILGVCVASALPRAGLPSALETCPSSWALMWSNNLLTAFDRSRATPLKKTNEASRRLQLELDLERRALTFHHRGLSGASCLIHRFTVDTEEPLHLGYRMLSGDAKGRLSITS